MKTPVYDLYSIPAPPGDGSRFYLATSPTGKQIAPETNIVGCLNRLAEDRREEMREHAPQLVEVKLKRVSLVGDEYVVEPRGSVSRFPSWESRRPGQRWRKLTGGACLDSFALGGVAFEKAPDLEVWEALRDVCDTHRVRGALRMLNDSVAVLVCLRAGIEVAAHELPFPAGLVREAA